MTGTTPSDIGPEQAGYQDISVPVYATVKGRASQIRSMPFTGDSSDDSSDGEGNNTAVSINAKNVDACGSLLICRRLMVQIRTVEAQVIRQVLVLENEPRPAAVVLQVKAKLGVCLFYV